MFVKSVKLEVTNMHNTFTYLMINQNQTIKHRPCEAWDQTISCTFSQDNCSFYNNERPRDENPFEWDCSLHLPLWVSKVERASIEDRLDEFTSLLEESGADVASLSSSLRKPLRPLWISQKSVIWLNEVPDHDSWDFTPIILVSASAPNGFLQQRTSSEFSWNYIPGAGDDEESWSRGLTPLLFWVHVYDLINSGPDLCNQKVAEIVERDRVYRAQRGLDAPQILVKSQRSSQSNEQCELLLHSEFENIKIGESASIKEKSALSWLGLTKIAVATTELAATTPDVDCILNCEKELLVVGSSYTYLHLPTVSSKLDRFSLLNNLPSAVNFARSNLSQGKSILVCCHDGEDISICVSLAILISLFTEDGRFDDGKSYRETQITKWEMRRRLVFICKYSVSARPSRGNLKQVFSFLHGGEHQSPKQSEQQTILERSMAASSLPKEPRFQTNPHVFT